MLPYRAIRSNETHPAERILSRESNRLHAPVFEFRYPDSLQIFRSDGVDSKRAKGLGLESAAIVSVTPDEFGLVLILLE